MQHFTVAAPAGKQSFLVFKNKKYLTVPTKNIAFFYVKYESSTMMCFDGREYAVNHSLEQIQQLLAPEQFFRLNRQYLINFYAIKEVELCRKPYRMLMNTVLNSRGNIFRCSSHLDHILWG